MSTCASCGDSFTEGENIVPCAVCLKLFHASSECTGVTPTAQRVFILKNPDPLVIFNCSKCKSNGGINSTLCKVLSELNDTVKDMNSAIAKVEEFTESITSMKLEISNLKKETNSLPDIKHNIANLLKVQTTDLNAIKNLKTDVKTLNKKLENLSSTSVDTNKNYYEFKSRLYKENNIIMYGLSENSTSDQESSQSLKSKVCQVLACFRNIDTNSITAFRLKSSKKYKNLPRPILIRFKSADEVVRIFKAKNKLPDGISIRNDRTKSELDYLKSLYDHVKEHNSQHPDQLTVKYSLGVPSIIRVDTSSS